MVVEVMLEEWPVVHVWAVIELVGSVESVSTSEPLKYVGSVV